MIWNIFKVMPDLPASGRFADLILEGRLAEMLAAWRAEDRGWDWIAKQLFALDARIDVSGVTVKTWHDRLFPPVTADEGAA